MSRQLTRQIVGLCMLFAVLVGLGAAMPQGGLPTPPVIKRLSSLKGDVFDGYAEFRLQQVEFDEFGNMSMTSEPYTSLVNIDYIIQLHRFEDAKKKDYSCLMYMAYPGKRVTSSPILVRQDYKTVLSTIRKASAR